MDEPIDGGEGASTARTSEQLTTQRKKPRGPEPRKRDSIFQPAMDDTANSPSASTRLGALPENGPGSPPGGDKHVRRILFTQLSPLPSNQP